MIYADTLRKWFTVLLDSRSAAEYAKGHILGALSFPPDSDTSLLASIPMDVSLVAYTQTGIDDQGIVASLSAAGYEAYSLLGGLDEWLVQGGSSLLSAEALNP